MNSKTEQHSSSDLLNIPSSEFVTQAYAKAAEINLSFPDVSAMLRAAAARIDTLKVLVNAASSANVERFTPDCKMHMHHEMAYMRPNPNGTFVSLGDYLTLQTERNDLNAQVRALASECASLKSNLMFWHDGGTEFFHTTPEEIADENLMECGTEFTVQVSARMPDRTYRVIAVNKTSSEIELVKGALPETPATDAILREAGAKALDDMAKEFGQIAQTLKPNSIAYRAAKSSVFKCVSAAARLRAGEVQP